MRTSLSSTHPTTGTGRRPRDRIGVAVGLTLFVLALVALHGAVRGFSLHDFARQASALAAAANGQADAPPATPHPVEGVTPGEQAPPGPPTKK